MEELKKFRFRAFISYSSMDRLIGQRFQDALERYKIPRPLRRRKTAMGEVPKRLSPVFRDRSDLEAAGDLGERINNALHQSRALIVLCSPYSAASKWVNQEISTFKQLGREQHIIAVLIDGDPVEYHPETSPNGAFPPALVRVIGLDGNLTDQRAPEPFAPDLREAQADGSGGDGFEYAKLKVVARLIDVPLAELTQREREAEKRERRIIQGVAAAMLVLTGLAFWQWQIALSNELQARQNLARSDFIRADQLASKHPAKALAYLARAIRSDPSSIGIGRRAAYLLSDHPFLVPAGQRQESAEFKPVKTVFANRRGIKHPSPDLSWSLKHYASEGAQGDKLEIFHKDGESIEVQIPETTMIEIVVFSPTSEFAMIVGGAGGEYGSWGNIVAFNRNGRIILEHSIEGSWPHFDGIGPNGRLVSIDGTVFDLRPTREDTMEGRELTKLDFIELGVGGVKFGADHAQSEATGMTHRSIVPMDMEQIPVPAPARETVDIGNKPKASAATEWISPRFKKQIVLKDGDVHIQTTNFRSKQPIEGTAIIAFSSRNEAALSLMLDGSFSFDPADNGRQGRDRRIEIWGLSCQQLSSDQDWGSRSHGPRFIARINSENTDVWEVGYIRHKHRSGELTPNCEAEMGAELSIFSREYEYHTSANWTDDKQTFAVSDCGRASCRVQILNASGELIQEPITIANQYVQLQFSADGTWIGVFDTNSGGDFGELRMIDAASGLKLRRRLSYRGGFREIDSGRRVLLGYDRRNKDEVQQSVALDILGDKSSLPMWLSVLSEAVSGYRLSETGVPKLLSDAKRSEMLGQVRAQIAAANQRDGWSDFGRWYLAENRTLSPYSSY